MHHAVNNLALSLSEIPIKSFVKETDSEPISEEKKRKFNLGFDGDDAKITYEEIISLESKKKSLPQNNQVESKKNDNKNKRSADPIDNSAITVNQIFKAIETGDREFVVKYLDRDNVNVTDQFGWTPLMSAAYSGYIQIVDFLLKIGAYTKARDKSGYTAIDLAARKNHVEIINLIKQKSRKNKKKSVESEIVLENTEESDKKIKKKIYCRICKIYFTESSVPKHESSTLHIFNTNPKVKNICYGIPKCNRGYQMLLNDGWDEEGGLGPSGEGQKYPVKTILKRDRKGLGEPDKKIAKVTHFNPGDISAVKNIHKNTRKTFTKRDRKKQLSREAAKTKALREALS